MFWRRDPESDSRLVNLCMWKAGEPGYTPAEIGGVLRPAACSGGGGLFSSVPSYMKILRTLLNDGVYKGTGFRLVSKDTVDLMMFSPLIEDPKQQKGMWEYVKNSLPLPSKHDDGFNLRCVPTVRFWSLVDSLQRQCRIRGEDHDGRSAGGASSWRRLWRGLPVRHSSYHRTMLTRLHASCTFWLIDRKAGITLTFMTDVAPMGHPVRRAYDLLLYAEACLQAIMKFYGDLEREIYGSLEERS